MSAARQIDAPLAKYDAARRALAEARNIDEVRVIHNQAVAIQAYARQAKDRQLIEHATDIRKRAERELGKKMGEQKANGERARAGGIGVKGKKSPMPTLEAIGVDKDLAKRARAAAAMPEAVFEASVAKAARVAGAAVEGNAAVIKEARQERQAEKRESRARRIGELAARTEAASKELGSKVFSLIYADPPWSFEPYSQDTGMDRAADNHYPTMTLDAIKAALPPPAVAADAALFLWATTPMLPQALEVMAAWGFAYRSHCVWVKDRLGTGYWFRNQHELLLLGTRGKIPAPAPGQQFPSIIRADVGEHSAKPNQFAEMIEEMFPDKGLEMFARSSRVGWECWGNEA